MASTADTEIATISVEHTVSLAEFRDASKETLDRLNRTGEAEVITVDGEERAVLVSPSVYREMVREAQLARDVENIRISTAQIAAGQYQTVDEVSREIREMLLARKAARTNREGQ